MAYIDKARVIGVLNQFKKEHSNLPSACLKMIDIALNIIKQIPTADVVEVVRCEKCKHKDVDAFTRTVCKRDFNIVEIKDTDFCSYGEKR